MPTPRKTTARKAAPKKATTPRAPRPSTPGPNVSGIAAKRAQIKGEDGTHVDPYAPTVWGSEDSSGSLVDLTVPSGQTVLAQRAGPEGLMTAGLLDDLDVLATVLPKVMGGKTKVKDFDATQVLKNPAMMKQAVSLLDRVTCYVVVKPEITPEPEDPRLKERGKIYPSSISLEDKSFLFNWAVGGTRDLSRFREQYAESVAGVESVEDVEDETV